MGNDESTSNGHDDDSANDTNNNCNESDLGQVFTAAISIGYNPTYNNSEKTVEPHLIAPAMHPKRHASMRRVRHSWNEKLSG
jgi:FAD synthase